MRNRSEIALLLPALIGLSLALYALPLHYQPSGSRICNLSETFNCDKVNGSPWSELFGVPVAGLGAIAYLALFVIVYRRRAIQGALAFTDKDFWMYAVIIALAMLGFQIYLTLAEILWIKAYCIVCLGSQVTTITITALAVWRWRAAR